MDILKSVGIGVGVGLLTMIGLYLFPSIVLLFPLAFIVLGVKYDIKYSFISLLITSILVGMGIDIISGTIVLGAFGPLALYIADSIEKRKRSFDIIVPSSIVFFISIVIIFVLLNGFSGINVIEQMKENLNRFMEIQMNVIEDMDLTNIETFRVLDFAENMYNYILSILPAILIIMSIFVSYINYYFSIKILRKLGIAIKEIPLFSRFILPSNFMIGTLIMFLSIYILGSFEIIQYDMIQLNLMVLIVTLLSIQGLSVFNYLLLRLKLKAIFRIVVVGLAIFISPLMTLLVMIGIADILFDFRKLRRQRL